MTNPRLVEYRFEGLILAAALESLRILGWWKRTERLQEALVIEPPPPLEYRELDILQSAPGTTLPNHLCLEQAKHPKHPNHPNHRLGQCVVV